MTPKVSVIIPTYNMAGFIGQAIDSVRRQTYPRLEIIIVDDASTDESAQVLDGIDDARLQVIRLEASGGPSAARNIGIRAAAGELIALLDADDVWLPTKLEKQVALFEADPSLGLVYCGAHEVDGELRYLRTPALGEAWPPPGMEAFRRIALRQSFIVAPLSSIVVRRDCFDQAGLFDEEIVQAEEWDLAFRLAHTWRIGFVAEPLVLYRMTGHFNPEKRLGRHIGEAHETAIERAFARLGDPPELEPLKVQALAGTRLGVGLYHYAMRQPEQAERQLERVAATDPAYLDLSANGNLRTSLAYVACGLYDTVTPLEEALDFVEYAFDHFPALVRTSPGDRRDVKAQVCAIAAFDSYPRGEILRVWKAVSKGVWLNRSFLRNRGLLKLLLQVLGRTRSSFSHTPARPHIERQR